MSSPIIRIMEVGSIVILILAIPLTIMWVAPGLFDFIGSLFGTAMGILEHVFDSLYGV